MHEPTSSLISFGTTELFIHFSCDLQVILSMKYYPITKPKASLVSLASPDASGLAHRVPTLRPLVGAIPTCWRFLNKDVI